MSARSTEEFKQQAKALEALLSSGKETEEIPSSPKSRKKKINKPLKKKKSITDPIDKLQMIHEKSPEVPKKRSRGNSQLFVAATSKNRPLTPEEQQKAFEEYLAAMEENELANNLKNNAKASAKLKMEAQEDTKVPVRVNKNRPLTREEQEIAVKEFMARQKAEKNKSQSLSPKPVKTTSLRLPRVLNRKPSKYIHYSILIWIP